MYKVPVKVIGFTVSDIIFTKDTKACTAKKEKEKNWMDIKSLGRFFLPH